MDRDERARLRALCEAATPGPWDAIYDEDAVGRRDGAGAQGAGRR